MADQNIPADASADARCSIGDALDIYPDSPADVEAYLDDAKDLQIRVYGGYSSENGIAYETAFDQACKDSKDLQRALGALESWYRAE